MTLWQTCDVEDKSTDMLYFLLLLLLARPGDCVPALPSRGNLTPPTFIELPERCISRTCVITIYFENV